MNKLPQILHSIALMSVILHSAAISAHPLERWQSTKSVASGFNLASVTYGNGLFVALGNGSSFGGPFGGPTPESVILTSTNGRDWNKCLTSAGLAKISYGDGTFAAIGNYSIFIPFIAVWRVSFILTSTNGVTWTRQDVSAGDVSLRDIVHGNGLFVAVAGPGVNDTNVVWTSSDGVAWHRRGFPAGHALANITYGNGLFVASGDRYTGSNYVSAIFTSPDATTWTEPSLPSQILITDIAWGNGSFVALIGGGGTLKSADGVNWTEYAAGDVRPSRSINFENGKFLACGNQNSAVVTSMDGVSWEEQRVPRDGLSDLVLADFSFGAGIYVAVGPNGVVLNSPDAQRWILCSGYSQSLSGVARGPNQSVAVGEHGTILTSDGGQSWCQHNTGTTNNLRSPTIGAGQFLAVGDQGTILTSSNGMDWTQENSGTDALLNSVAFGNGLFVAVGTAGTILTSQDLFTWTGQTSGTVIVLKGVSYGNGLFVAVGGGFPNMILTSPDGITWTEQQSSTFAFLNAITFGNGMFVAVGGGTGCAGEGECSDQGIIIISTDGITWAASQQYVFGILAGIGFGNGTFVAVGGGCAESVWVPGGPYCSPVLLSSTDGTNWTGHPTPTNQFLKGVAYGQGTFVVVGVRGVIIQSGSFTPGELSGPRRPSNAEFQLSVTGEIGRTYRLQTTANLSVPGWTDLFSFTLAAPTTNLVHNTVGNVPTRFYRLVSP